MKVSQATIRSDRALVLGGGGASGNAWLIGVIAGLLDAGLDVSKADLIIGTSAGATTAAQISCSSPAELFSSILGAPSMPTARLSEANRRMPVKAVNHLDRTRSIINAAHNAAEMRQRIGKAALEMEGSSDKSVQTHWRTIVASRLPSEQWPPQPLLITAVDACNGDPIVFNNYSGITLVDAVAASCAGGFAYTIGDNQYIDGGYRADVNVDLAAGYGRVLVIAPLGTRTRKPLHWGLHLEAQVEELRVGGSSVETIFPDSNSRNALGVGMKLLDLSTRRPSAQAGFKQGKAIIEKLNEFWVD